MFDKFNFTKNWTDPMDFPTIETDEERVRGDMQCLHDETRQAIHALIEALAAQTGAVNIGARAYDKTVNVQAILDLLLDDTHSHADHSALEQLASAFAGMTLATTLTNDATKIPTAKAVLDSMIAAGAGDMMRRIYDPRAQSRDIFKYTDDAVAQHANVTNNPHNVTAAQIGLENVNNTTDADKPISKAVENALKGKVNTTDVVDVAHGGTGAKTVRDARKALGLGDTDGPLPLTSGGTGATTVAGVRDALGLGNSSGPLPVANGGTGANTPAVACANLGAMPKAGGAFTGPVTLHQIILTPQDYGTSFPTTDLTPGRLYLKKV